METFLKIDTSIVCICFLMSITFYILKHMPKNMPTMKLLTATVLLNTMGLIIEAFSIYVIDYANIALKEMAYFFYFLSNILYFLTVFVWSNFIYAYAKGNKKPTKTWLTLITLPCIAGGILQILNFKSNILFYIDEQNNLVRGKFFILFVLCIASYLVINLVILQKNKKRLTKSEYVTLTMFQFIPLLGALIYIVVPYGINTIWIYSAYTLIMISLYLNNAMMRFDILTGAWKRAAFDKYTDELSKKNMTDFSVAFLDMDDFKEINDTYGHAVGDKALKKFASLASSALGDGDILVRYGGDEFLLFFNTKDMTKVNKTLEKMQNKVEEFNKKNIDKYKLKYTCKAEAYDENVYRTISELIHFVDSEMYKEKALKKKKRKMLGI